MTKVGLRELKNRLGTYIAKVRAGETVVVTDRGVVVAELKPPASTHNAVLDEMVRKGEIRLGQPIKDRKALYPVMPPVLMGITSRELLDAEREDSAWMPGTKKADEPLR